MKKTIILLSTAAAMILMMSFSLLSKDGKAGYTGSPNETACNSCHTGSLNPTGGSITITTTPAMNSWKYTPGATYTVNVTVAKTGATLFGVGFEALNTSNANAGTLTAGAGTKTETANSRVNIVHTGSGNTGTGTHTFSFTWKAPSPAIGNITFYAAGNAANKNGTTTGDFIYTTSQVLTPGSPDGIDEKDLFAKHVGVYPNPATDHLQITNVNPAEEMTVSIMDMKGDVVSKKQNITNDNRIELSELNAGSYLLRIEAGGKVAVKQFVKQ